MERLKMLRTQRGLTQTQVGDVIGVSCVTIARYEAGDREPSNAKIKALADFFGVTVDYLMGRDNQPKSTKKEPIQVDELLVRNAQMLTQLSPQEWQRVQDFVQGLVAARTAKDSPHK